MESQVVRNRESGSMIVRNRVDEKVHRVAVRLFTESEREGSQSEEQSEKVQRVRE